MTALMWAAQRGYIDLLRLLLDRGAAVNIKKNVSVEVILGW